MKQKYFYTIYLLLILIIWQLTDIIFSIPSYLVPSPIELVETFFGNFNLLFKHTLVTISEGIFGLIIAIFLGIFIAIIMDFSNFFQKLFSPIITVSQTIPMVITATLFIIFFGYGYLTKILFIVILCFFPITLATYDGLKNVDKEYLGLFEFMKASPYKLYKYLKIPSSIHQIFSGIKIATTYAYGSAVLAEFMGSKAGLGYYLSRALESYETNIVFLIAIIIIIVTFISLKIIDIIECSLTSKFNE